MAGIVYIVVLIGVLCLLLSVKVFLLESQIRNLTRQLEEIAGGETEKVLDLSLIDKNLEKMAVQLNRNFLRQKRVVAKAIGHEEHLKEAVANISHDLRTPLTVIMGYLQLLKQSDLSREQAQQVNTALHKAVSLKEFIEAFYELSVADADSTKPQAERVNVSNLLMDLVAEFVPLFDAKHLHPKVHIPEKSLFITADKNMLERIVQNLLSNAVKYSAGEIGIRLSAADESCGEGSAVLLVENSVTEDFHVDTARIFDRFYTGDASRGGGSTGVGLAVVRILSEKMGGSVRAEMRGRVLRITVVK